MNRSAAPSVLLAVAAAGVLALSACGSSSGGSNKSADSGSGQTFTIGVLLPLSGPTASFGAEAKKGIETAVSLINSSHPSLSGFLGSGPGLPNHNGAKVKVVYADYAGDTQEAGTQTTKLISQDHVQLIEGALLSGATAVASKIAEANHIPFLSDSATDPSLSKQGYKWFFNANTNDTAIAKTTLDFVAAVNQAKKAGLSKIGIIVEDSQYGQTAAGNLKAAISATAGMHLVSSVTYQTGAPNLTAPLQKLKSANPDVVIADTIGSDAATMLRDMNTVGLNMKMLIGRGGFEDPDVISAYGKLMTGLVTADLYSPDLAKTKPVVKAVQTQFQKSYNEPLNGTAARPLAGILVAADALNRAKSYKADDIRTALQATNLKGDDIPLSWNGVKFDPSNNTNTASTVLVLQYQGTAFTTVYPQDEAVAQVQYPFAPFSSR